MGLIHEAQISLMHNSRWLQGVALAFSAEVGSGELTEFAVNEGREFIEGVRVALGPFRKQESYFMGI
jgi:hypothetical protein